MTQKRVDIVFHKQAAGFYGHLREKASSTPGSEEAVLYSALRSKIMELRAGGPTHHKLENQPRIGDLSDCYTDYIWTDEGEKPTHRLVTRPVPPKEYGQLPTRQIIAIGRRQDEHAYKLAAQNLGREPYVSLDDMRQRNIEASQNAAQRAESKQDQLNSASQNRQYGD